MGRGSSKSTYDKTLRDRLAKGDFKTPKCPDCKHYLKKVYVRMYQPATHQPLIGILWCQHCNILLYEDEAILPPGWKLPDPDDIATIGG